MKARQITLPDIEAMMRECRLDDAYMALLEYVKTDSSCAKAWYLLGGIYRRQELWGDAINAYNKAKMLEPDGPADAAIESIYDIIRFVNKDLMNP